MKLEVGMYVRHHYYGIGKITNRYESSNKTWFNVKFKCDGEDEGNCGICEQSIGVKASNNIIDLIEENDLLEIRYLIKPNEYQREALQVIKNYTGKLYVNAFPRKIFIEDFNSYGVEILSVETKEQFESMSYKVGE